MPRNICMIGRIEEKSYSTSLEILQGMDKLDLLLQAQGKLDQALQGEGLKAITSQETISHMQQEIKNALERDNFMTPAEAKAFGLIDEVVEKRS